MSAEHVFARQSDDVAAIARACATCDPACGADGLLAGLGHLWPELSFRTVLTRGGWYRSGGVVDIDKQRVADSLGVWAERNTGGDLQPLLDYCSQTQLFATRVVGRTHYLTAQTGPSAADFMQLEVEELQEVLDRYLSDPDWLPDSLQEFIDPLEYSPLEPEPVGSARLLFRRLFSAREVIKPLDTTPAEGPLQFMQEWDHSSAMQSGPFCNHWVLAVQESTDSSGDRQVSAHPIPTRSQERLRHVPGVTGSELANLIHGYDRDAGYPMAWYFHMVASAGVSHTIGAQVADDHEQGFEYVPARDLELLRNWVVSPYRA